ncbi:hypothetical protein NW762_011721 [Fusarium torreyae]|uniref:Uncharacterized protein n=1 Tax=Fusarium torreyae TaxID=1237075 RepID=A0A9W8VAF1_9HYPO|nr:hypothetical protein NW762_011721 [Fusarium torreyae]
MEDLLFRHEYLERKARNEEVDKDKSPGTSSIKESIASKELYDGESVDHQSPPSCISIEILKDSAQASVVSERQGHAAGEENVSEDNDGKGPSDVRDEWTKRVQVEDVEDDDTIFYATYARRPAIEAAPDSEAESINQTAHETRDSTEAYHGHETIVERLVEVSQELFWDFVPKQGSVPVHHVSKRFWGALDGILRQIAWSVVVTKKPTQWKIRESMRTTNKPGHSDSLTFSDCEACSTGATYQHCDAALEHLHSHHIHCPRTHIVGRPYDDPCFVWLEVSKQGKNEQKPTSLEDIELFLARLVEIRKTTHDLHCLVATAPHEERTTSAKLSLPMNLVYAFEEIINLFIMQGKQCSIITRVGNSQKHSEKITRMKERTEKAFLNIGDLLEASYADIILLSTKPRNLDILGLDHIGPEFIVGALVLSLQNRHLSRGEGTELLQVYRQYILKLRYQVSRRPQRRLFLEIDGLFEELEALFNLTNSQKKVLEDYRTLLAPASLRITTQLREKLFGIESQYIERQIKTLQDRINEIHQLRQQTASLRERVRQMIEILEEGHGRAIRVFTVVTLFFLPLSFTSSFFGMNTTDIRDIGYDQRVFWTVSIPVTAGILALAFIYAYKGDEIEDYITLAINSRKAKRAVQPKDEGHPARAETWFSMTSGVEEHSHDGHLDNGLNGWSRVGQRLRRKQGVAVSGETTRSMEV